MLKILILANNDMGLFQFRKELLGELTKQKNEIYISVPKGIYVPKLESMGLKLVETNFNRRGINPYSDLKLILFYVKTIKRIKPDVVLTYTIKPNVYGGIACRITNTPYIANITGGVGTSAEIKNYMRSLSLQLYRIGLKEANCVFFQNKPNKQLFIEENIVSDNARLIPGSGVNLEKHNFEDYPQNDDIIKFLFIGRVMKAKGIDELLAAAENVKKKYTNVQFDIIGNMEEAYSKKFLKYEKSKIINYHGSQEDVHSFIKNAHATILPSYYHEGINNGLLESAATGRPLLASRSTGCIETFDEGVSGFGFEPKNVRNLTEVIIKFIELPYEKKKAMGLAGRKKMEREYDRQIVINAYIEELKKFCCI